MTIDFAIQDRRHGDGWVAYVGPTTITLLVHDDDETAMAQALQDLSTYSDPTDWVTEQSGWCEDGCSYFVFTWEPAL